MKLTRAIVTGASGGIGSEIAFSLSKNGIAVILGHNNSEDAVIKTAERIKASGGWAKPVKCDLSSREGAFELAKAAADELGGADILVNNAGTALSKLFCDVTEDELEHLLSVDLKAAFYLSQAVLPMMQKNSCGRIINVASVWGETGASMEVAYSMAKAGIIGFTKALAKEAAPITVNAVSPGVIDTRMLSLYTKDELSALAEEIPLGRLGEAKEVAETVAFLASEKASYITGQDIAVNGGFYI